MRQEFSRRAWTVSLRSTPRIILSFTPSLLITSSLAKRSHPQSSVSDSLLPSRSPAQPPTPRTSPTGVDTATSCLSTPAMATYKVDEFPLFLSLFLLHLSHQSSSARRFLILGSHTASSTTLVQPPHSLPPHTRFSFVFSRLTLLTNSNSNSTPS